MSFVASNNSIVIRDADGAEMFNTEDKMPAIYATVSGLATLPQVSPNTDTSTTEIILETGLNPNTAFILSSIPSKVDENSQVNSNGSLIAEGEVINEDFIAFIRVIDFVVNPSGELVLVQRAYNYTNFTYSEVTFTYKCSLGIYA